MCSSDLVAVISTSTNLVTGSITVGAGPEGVTFSPDGTEAFVPNSAGSVSVIDVATQTALAPLPSGDGSRIFAINSGETRAYVSNTGGTTVSVYTIDPPLIPAAGPTLPTTGVDAGWAATVGWLGAVLLVVGAILLAVTRRRSRET